MVASPSALPAHRLRRTLEPLIRKAATRSQADRYRKRFSTRAHLWMLLIHAMSGARASGKATPGYAPNPPCLTCSGWKNPSASVSWLVRRPRVLLCASSSCSPRCWARLALSVLKAQAWPASVRARSSCWTPRSPVFGGQAESLGASRQAPRGREGADGLRPFKGGT
jgi:hypothetical protein